MYEDIQLPFKSDDELCPVTSYSISEKSNETDIFSLMDNKVAMYDKPIGSGNYTIIFDFPKMYEDFEEEKVKIFYIVAATKSKVVKA